MAKVMIRDGSLVYRKYWKQRHLKLSDLVWAYRQQEDASAMLCCGRANLVINRIIVQDQNGVKTAFPFERVEDAKQLLDEIAAAAPHICIGYTAENKAKFKTETYGENGNFKK